MMELTNVGIFESCPAGRLADSHFADDAATARGISTPKGVE